MYPGSSPRLLLTLLIPGALIASGCPQEDPQAEAWEIQKHYQKGSLALTENDLQTAERQFRLVLAKDAEHLNALNKLGRVLVLQAKVTGADRPALLREAIELLQRASTRDPERKMIWNLLAEAYRENGQVPEALQAYRTVLKVDAKDTRAWLAMADLQAARGAWAEATGLYRQALEKHPESGALRLAYGRFLVQRKQDAEAEKQFRAVPASAPEFYEALDELGGLAARQGKMQEVRRIYRQLIEMNPEDYLAWELLAALDEREKKYKDAEAKYRKSLEVDRAHMSAWMGLGRTLRAQDRKQEAVYAFRKADAFLARNPQQALELADEVAALGERKWALSVLRRARIAAEDQQLIEAIQAKIGELDPGPAGPAPQP